MYLKMPHVSVFFYHSPLCEWHIRRRHQRFFQPDRLAIDVRLFGGYPAIYGESIDGYTLVKDNASDWYCYAVIKDGGADLALPNIMCREGCRHFTLSKHLRRNAAVDEKRIADFAAANPVPQINALYKTRA